MTKTKVSTIAIVVLSVLLAAALAATIVLAAFSFTRSATTTITFASGLTLNGTGIDGAKWEAYALGNTGAKGDKLEGLTNITTGVALSNIQVTNPNTQTVTVAVAVVATATEGVAFYTSSADTMTTGKELADSTVTPNFATGTPLAATSTNAPSVANWLTIEIPATETKTVVDYIHTVFAPGKDGLDTLKGSITGTFYIAAVYGTGATATAALQTAIAEGEFVTSGFGAVTQS